MRIQLKTGWLSHPAGTVLDLGAGQAELLLSRGIATTDIATPAGPEIKTKEVPGPRRDRDKRRRDRVSRETR